MIQNLVSVIIPTYNRAYSIKRAISSVKRQTYRPIEIIIVDDFSQDNTKQLLQKYDFGDIPHTYFQHSKNIWPGGARNTAMKLSKGEYLAFIDSDDEWTCVNKIVMQVNFLRANPDYGFVATAWQVMNVGVTHKMIWFTDDNSFRKIALKYCPAHTSSWLFQRTIFEKIGWFWVHWAEDYEYLLRIWCQQKCYCMPVVTEKYFSSQNGHYKNNIVRNVAWTFCVCLKYSFNYPNFFSSLSGRILRLLRKFV